MFAISRPARHELRSRYKDEMREVLSQFPFFVQELFPFLLTRTSAVHRDVISEVYAKVVYAMGSTDAFAQAYPRMFHDLEVIYYNRILRVRGRSLVKQQR